MTTSRRTLATANSVGYTRMTIGRRVKLGAVIVVLGALLATGTAWPAEGSAQSASTGEPPPVPDGFILPLEPGTEWVLKQGPHGRNGPGGLDFGPRPQSASNEFSVVAIADGTARWLWCSKTTGKSPGLLVVDHGGGWWSAYFHVVSNRGDLDSVGDAVEVERGEPIAGLIGPHPGDNFANESCGGESTGPHLHFALGYQESGAPTAFQMFRTPAHGGVLVSPLDYSIGGWTALEEGPHGAIKHENGDVIHPFQQPEVRIKVPLLNDDDPHVGDTDPPSGADPPSQSSGWLALVAAILRLLQWLSGS